MEKSRSFRAYNIILLLLFLVPFLTGLLLVYGYASNVPYRDQWNSDVKHLLAFYKGSFTIQDLIEAHNDHRPVISRLVYYPIEFITHGNFKILAIVGYLIHSLSFLLIISHIKGWFTNQRLYLACIFPLSLFWFNLYLSSAFLCGLSIDHALCIMFAIVTAILLSKSSSGDYFFYLSVVTAICSMFSFTAGMFTWIAGSVVILYQKGSGYLQRIIIWVLTATSMLLINYVILGFSAEGRHGFAGYQLYIHNFFTYLPYKVCNIIGSLGSQITNGSYKAAMVSGLILLIMVGMAGFIYHRNAQKIEPSILFLLVFAVFTCAAIAVTRSGQVVDFGSPELIGFLTAWRQYPVTFILVPSVYLFLIKLCLTMGDCRLMRIIELIRNRDLLRIDPAVLVIRILVIICVVLMLISSVVNGFQGIKETERWKEETDEDIIRNSQQMNDSVLQSLYYPAIIRQYIPEMKKYNLSVFSER